MIFKSRRCEKPIHNNYFFIETKRLLKEVENIQKTYKHRTVSQLAHEIGAKSNLEDTENIERPTQKKKILAQKRKEVQQTKISKSEINVKEQSDSPIPTTVTSIALHHRYGETACPSPLKSIENKSITVPFNQAMQMHNEIDDEKNSHIESGAEKDKMSPSRPVCKSLKSKRIRKIVHIAPDYFDESPISNNCK